MRKALPLSAMALVVFFVDACQPRPSAFQVAAERCQEEAAKLSPDLQGIELARCMDNADPKWQQVYADP